MQSDELNDSQKVIEGGFTTVSQQEYINRLHELKDEIRRSWSSDERVASLKLSIKVVSHCYFLLVLTVLPLCLLIFYSHFSSMKSHFFCLLACKL